MRNDNAALILSLTGQRLDGFTTQSQLSSKTLTRCTPLSNVNAEYGFACKRHKDRRARHCVLNDLVVNDFSAAGLSRNITRITEISKISQHRAVQHTVIGLVMMCLPVQPMRNDCLSINTATASNEICGYEFQLWPKKMTTLNRLQESWAVAKMTARCALYVWVPWKFSGVPDYAHGYCYLQNVFEWNAS